MRVVTYGKVSQVVDSFGNPISKCMRKELILAWLINYLTGG